MSKKKLKTGDVLGYIVVVPGGAINLQRNPGRTRSWARNLAETLNNMPNRYGRHQNNDRPYRIAKVVLAK